MKRIISLSLFILMIWGASGQKPSLTRAYNLYYDKNFVKAKEVIDLCTQNEKLATKPQTWLYKGNIYFYLANQEYGEKQKNSEYIIQFPDAPVEAYLAFQKAEKINKNAEAFDMLGSADGKARLYALLLIRGVDRLIENDLQEAKRILEMSIESYESHPPATLLKGEIYYYYAYTLELLHQTEAAIANYEKAINDGSTNPNVYIRMIEYYKNSNNKEKVRMLINSGKRINPEDPNILVAEVDYFYWTGDTLKAYQQLKNLPSSVYSNPDAIVNIANFYIKENQFIKADSLLKKANQLNPDNFVIVYNLGYCNLKMYEQKFMEANSLAVQGNKTQSNIANTLADNYLINAQKYFEKALSFEPDDLNILEQLKEIYARKESPEYETIIKRINSLKKQ